VSQKPLENNGYCEGLMKEGSEMLPVNEMSSMSITSKAYDAYMVTRGGDSSRNKLGIP
jgi:hypothetical protein